MAENKTHFTDVAIEDFLATVTPDRRAADARVLIEMMTRLTGEEARMYGPSIIGFGTVRYRYDSGREGNMPAIAFAPRKAESVLYVGASTPNIAALLPRLGKHRTGKGCLYVKSLADIDAGVLDTILRTAFENHRPSAPD